MQNKDLEKQLGYKVMQLQDARSKIGVFNIIPKGAFALLGYNVEDVDLSTLKDYAMWILRDYITFNRVVENVVNEVEPNLEETEND